MWNYAKIPTFARILTEPKWIQCLSPLFFWWLLLAFAEWKPQTNQQLSYMVLLNWFELTAALQPPTHNELIWTLNRAIPKWAQVTLLGHTLQLYLDSLDFFFHFSFFPQQYAFTYACAQYIRTCSGVLFKVRLCRCTHSQQTRLCVNLCSV